MCGIPNAASGHWPRVAVIAWVATCLGLAVHGYAKPHRHTLFPVYATGIRAWWSGSERLYERQPATGEFYRYSPAFAVAAGPLCFLPPGAGNAAWKLLNVAVFVAGLLVWCRRAAPGPRSPQFTAAVFLVALVAVIGNVANGQANLLMTGLTLLGLAAAARERWWAAAGLLAAATLIKVFPVALALVLCVLFWRKFPLRYAAALAAGLALPVVVQSPEYALDRTGEWVRHLASSGDLNRERLRSLDKLFEVAGWGVSRREFRALAALAGLGVLVVGVGSARRGLDRQRILFRVAAWYSAWVVLFSPSSEQATFSILGPFVAWALADELRRPGARVWRAALAASVYLMSLSTGDGGGPLAHFFTTHNATALGALIFVTWLAADLVRREPAALAEAEASPAPRRAA